MARSVVSSAKLIAVCTLVSRVTGLLRDILLARAFGMAWVQDAFQYAFQFPNLFRRLFGEGALAAAFVPTFTRVLDQEGLQSAWALLARTLALITVTLAGLVALIALIIGGIWLFVPCPVEHVESRGLLLALTAMMLPFMLTICVVALFSSILNCLRSFVPAALMPVMLNGAMILGIAVLGPALRPGDPRAQAFVVAATVLVAGVLQVLVMIPVLRRYGVRLGWRLDTRDPAVRRMLTLVVPILLGQGVLAFGVFLDAQVCVLLTHKAGTTPTFELFGRTISYPLKEGALATVTYAQRLYQFPLGVLVISLATAALPAFSQLAARQAWPAWTQEVRQSLRLAVFEGLLTGAMMIVLAVPIFRLLFEYGRVGPDETARASLVIRWYGAGLWAFCAQHIVLRAFYSMHDVRTPLLVSVGLLPLNLLMNLSLVWSPAIREAAFAISTTTTASLTVLVGLLLLGRRTGTRVVDRESLAAALKMLLATAAAAATVHLTAAQWAALGRLVPNEVLSRAVETLGALALGTAAYMLVAWMLGVREVALLMGRWRRGGKIPAA